MSRKEDREIVLGNMVTALNMLEKSRDFALVIPEIRASLAFATPWAKNVNDVAGVEGRIVAVGGYPRASSIPAFGASTHMAGLILDVRGYDPEISAAMNFKCNQEIIGILKEYAGEKGFKFGMVDRNMPAPPGYNTQVSHWRIRYMIEKLGGVPRIFYENEGMGREQLSIALGKDAVEVTKMALEIARRYRGEDKKIRTVIARSPDVIGTWQSPVAHIQQELQKHFPIVGTLRFPLSRE